MPWKRIVRKLEGKYQLAQELETRCENYLTEDAEVLVGRLRHCFSRAALDGRSACAPKA